VLNGFFALSMTMFAPCFSTHPTRRPFGLMH
jgi:hypothetical protein